MLSHWAWTLRGLPSHQVMSRPESVLQAGLQVRVVAVADEQGRLAVDAAADQRRERVVGLVLVADADADADHGLADEVVGLGLLVLAVDHAGGRAVGVAQVVLEVAQAATEAAVGLGQGVVVEGEHGGAQGLGEGGDVPGVVGVEGLDEPGAELGGGGDGLGEQGLALVADGLLALALLVVGLGDDAGVVDGRAELGVEPLLEVVGAVAEAAAEPAHAAHGAAPQLGLEGGDADGAELLDVLDELLDALGAELLGGDGEVARRGLLDRSAEGLDGVLGLAEDVAGILGWCAAEVVGPAVVVEGDVADEGPVVMELDTTWCRSRCGASAAT